jgi:hypothetical protein
MDMRFGTWNVRSMYRAGSLRAVGELREIGWDGVDWMDMAQDRGQWRSLVNTVLNLQVPYIAGKFLSCYTIGGSSRRAQVRE